MISPCRKKMRADLCDRSGKVRELFKLEDDSSFLMAVTDRISAYDAVLASGIPDKGAVLCQISGSFIMLSSNSTQICLWSFLEDKCQLIYSSLVLRPQYSDPRAQASHDLPRSPSCSSSRDRVRESLPPWSLHADPFLEGLSC